MRRPVFVLALMVIAISAAAQQAKPAPKKVEKKETATPLGRGKLVYAAYCLACHQADGSGVPNLAPPLIQGTFVPDKQRLITIVLNGMQDVEIRGEVYANPMPAFDYLSDKEIADVLTFVRSNFDNKGISFLSTSIFLLIKHFNFLSYDFDTIF